jgi:hypothetical protein
MSAKRDYTRVGVRMHCSTDIGQRNRKREIEVREHCFFGKALV